MKLREKFEARMIRITLKDYDLGMIYAPNLCYPYGGMDNIDTYYLRSLTLWQADSITKSLKVLICPVSNLVLESE